MPSRDDRMRERRLLFQCPACLQHTSKRERIGDVCATCYPLWVRGLLSIKPPKPAVAKRKVCKVCKWPDDCKAKNLCRFYLTRRDKA